jgi:hypothetical protein
MKTNPMARTIPSGKSITSEEISLGSSGLIAPNLSCAAAGSIRKQCCFENQFAPDAPREAFSKIIWGFAQIRFRRLCGGESDKMFLTAGNGGNEAETVSAPVPICLSSAEARIPFFDGMWVKKKCP